MASWVMEHATARLSSLYGVAPRTFRLAAACACRPWVRSGRRAAALAESDSEGRPRIAAAPQGTPDLGWTEGLNIRSTIADCGDGGPSRAYAAEILALRTRRDRRQY